MMPHAVTEGNDLRYLSLPEFGNGGVRHFFTTRRFSGTSPLPFGSKEEFVMVKQVHGDDILIIDQLADDVKAFAEYAGRKHCDAIITNQRNTGIGVVSADCLPALLYDPVRSVIAALHAGWRGSLKCILSKVITQMGNVFNCQPEDILAGIGPVIGSCCYVVGNIVTEPMKEINPDWDIFLKPEGDGKARLDLTALNIAQMEDSGLLKKNIFPLGMCTSCNESLFPSYRRDGIGTGRIISGIIMD